MAAKQRVCAVSYLNTAPLIWGLTHGPQRGTLDVRFALPSECAEQLRAGDTDVGLVPVIELARQPDLLVVPGCGISGHGAVRSVLLVSKKPFDAIESFAADTGSRTSTVLTQIVAAHKHGLRPQVRPYPPRLNEMLEIADAALVIGDPALQIDPSLSSWRGQPVHVYDLGSEWHDMTGLPMVFGVWGVKKLADADGLQEALLASASFGLSRLDEIVDGESRRLGFDPKIVRRYLTQQVHYMLGEHEREAMRLYLRLAAELGLAEAVYQVPFLAAPALSG